MNVSKGVRGFTKIPVEERFWSRVEKTDGCWIWRGTTDGRKGYGQFWFNGRQRKATHIAMMLHGIDLPPGMQACHHCDNPSCVRPDHLFAGTNRDNALDSMAKGRHANSSATACSRGHAWTTENTYFDKRGVRNCRACRKLTRQRLRAFAPPEVRPEVKP